MDPAQAPAPTPDPSTAVTATPPASLGVPIMVPPELRPALLGAEPSRPEVPPPSSAAGATVPEKAPLLATWPRSAQWATAFLLGVVVTLLVVHILSMSGGRPADLHPAYRVDLNTADVAELQQLPGIGPNLARRIDEHRRIHGDFRSVDDLRKVPGIGPKTLERLREFVIVETADEEEEPPAKLVKPPAKATKSTTKSKKELALAGVVIDVNRAPAAELQRLPNVGPKLAQRILDTRAKGEFKTVSELRRVPGIGPKILEKLRPYVTVGRAPAVAAAPD
jgi:competence protein ComEA